MYSRCTRCVSSFLVIFAFLGILASKMETQKYNNNKTQKKNNEANTKRFTIGICIDIDLLKLVIRTSELLPTVIRFDL